MTVDDVLSSSMLAYGLMPKSSSGAGSGGNYESSQTASAVELAPINITPSMPVHPPSSSTNEMGASASDSASRRELTAPSPSPAFASFFGSTSSVTDAAPRRSLKNNEKRHDRLELEPFLVREGSPHEPQISKISKPSMVLTQLVEPSSPSMVMASMPAETSSGKSPNKKRCLEGSDDASARSEDEQPHTPKYRCLLQGLSLNSPVLSSASGTPEEEAVRSVVKAPFLRPPNIPSFVPKKDCITISETFESLTFSAGNTPMGTPDTGPFFVRSPEKISPGKLQTPTTVSSSFHSIRSYRTCIGHQNSPFKMLPPRIDQQDSIYSPPTQIVSSSPCTSSPTRFPPSSLITTSSLSPRVVPLTILSRDGSPVTGGKIASATSVIPKLSMKNLPYDPSTSSQALMSSPLMRSLDRIAKNDSSKENGKEELRVAMHSMNDSSPKSSGEYHQLPRIKLTPRSKNNYASLMLDVSPGGKARPCLNLLPSSGHPRRERGEDREAAEMDYLLSGFGHHSPSDNKSRILKQSLSNNLLGRVESEESEMVAIAHAPLLIPSFCNQPKPLQSITFKSPEHYRDEKMASPSFLPRFLPSAKCRSLFNPSHADDRIEQILRADAMAEAAKSNEDLTDDESDSEGLGSDFLLCSPKTNASKMLHKTEKRPAREAMLPLKPAFRAESPSFVGKLRTNSIGSFKKKRSFSSPATPTIAEEGFAIFDRDFCKGSTSNEDMCSLSDYDDTMISPYHSHPLPPTNGIAMKTTNFDYPHSSLHSMSSLYGLDIVDESPADELRDKVPPSLPSESSQLFRHSDESDMGLMGFRPMRSELSQNSLGLSVDSAGDADQRDLFTPPVTTMRSMQSPPPLPKRVPNFQNF